MQTNTNYTKMKYDPLIDYGETDLSLENNLTYWKFSELIKILIIISSKAEKQIEYIGIGAAADEMAIDFDTYYTLLVQSYIEYNLISFAQKEKLDELDRYFEIRGGNNNPDFWDDCKLGTNPEWETARQKAQEILVLLGRENLTIEYDRKEEYNKNNKLTMQWTKIKLIDKNAP